VRLEPVRDKPNRQRHNRRAQQHGCRNGADVESIKPERAEINRDQDCGEPITARSYPTSYEKEPPLRRALEDNILSAIFATNGHGITDVSAYSPISINPTSLTRLLAITGLPSRVTAMFRTM